MNGAFHSKRDVDMFYVSREDGGWGLISSGGCVRGEENSLEWEVRTYLDVLLQETWSCLRKADSKIQTKALICVGQEQALRTNHITDTTLTIPCDPPYVGNVTRRRECTPYFLC